MAISITFSLIQPREKLTRIRADVRYNFSFLPFNQGGEIQRFSFVISPMKIEGKHLKNQRVSSKSPFSKELNWRIESLIERALKAHIEFLIAKKFPTPDKFKKMLQMEGEEMQQERTILQDFQAWKSLPDTVKPSRVYQFRFLDTVMQEKFSGITYQNINSTFLTDVEKHIRETQRKTASVNLYMSTIFSFLAFANKEGWNDYLYFKNYKLSQIKKTLPITLTQEEIQRILNYKPKDQNPKKNQRIEAVRDAFVIACYTGIRYSDWANTRLEKTKDGYNLCLVVKKTKEYIEIPVVAKVWPVIQRMQTNDLMKKLSKTFVRTELDLIIKSVGITKKTGTHTARRTCATYFESLGVARSAIMRITGHKSEDAYLRYVGIAASVNAEIVRREKPEIFKIA